MLRCYAKMLGTRQGMIRAMSELQGWCSRGQQVLPGVRCGSSRTLSVVRKREPGECQILLRMRSQTAGNWR
jgi:hypothetical protein